MKKTYKEMVRQDYASAIMPEIKLIDGKYPYSRGYDCLSLKEFLKICYPGRHNFIEGQRLSLYNEYLDTTLPGLTTHADKYQFLKQIDRLPEITKIEIRQLKFYQDEINLDRLDTLAVENYLLRPVLVLKFENDLVLQDGYHRTFIAMINKVDFIECYLL